MGHGEPEIYIINGQEKGRRHMKDEEEDRRTKVNAVYGNKELLECLKDVLRSRERKGWLYGGGQSCALSETVKGR